jgi:hypothetical protein
MNFKKFSREVEKAEKGIKGREHFENVLAFLCIPPLSVPAVYVSLAIYYPLRDFITRYCYHKDSCLEFISSSAGDTILSIVSAMAVGALSCALWDMFLRSLFQSLSEAMLSARRARKLGGMDVQSAGRALRLLCEIKDDEMRELMLKTFLSASYPLVIREKEFYSLEGNDRQKCLEICRIHSLEFPGI